MKKAIIFSFMLVLALGLFSCNGKKSNYAGNEMKETKETKETKEATEETTSQEVPEKVLGYVDLGLPSGTLWKETNERGFCTWEEDVSYFGDELPTQEQFLELRSECTWTWTGNGYEVTGPNGNSIYLPAAGRRSCDGSVGFVGSVGYYRSSSHNGSNYAWTLVCSSRSGVYMDLLYRCTGQSVRLVK